MDIFKGNVWKLEDNVSIESILPSSVLYKYNDLESEECKKHIFKEQYKDWYKEVKPGDAIIAGKNFGWGSSRPASRLLKKAGISCIIAESTSRLFYRNSIHIGLPVIICDDISKYFSTGDNIEVNIEDGTIKNNTNNHNVTIEPLSKESPPYQILEAGGLEEYIKQNMEGSI